MLSGHGGLRDEHDHFSTEIKEAHYGTNGTSGTSQTRAKQKIQAYSTVEIWLPLYNISSTIGGLESCFKTYSVSPI